MWELADSIVNCSDHICSKYWLLEELLLRVDELESEVQTLRPIRDGEKYLDALFQEAVTPGRLNNSNLVSGQGQQAVTKIKSPAWCCLPSARVRDISEQLERILEQEGEDPVVFQAGTNNV
eukprot:g19890.t1